MCKGTRRMKKYVQEYASCAIIRKILKDPDYSDKIKTIIKYLKAKLSKNFERLKHISKLISNNKEF